MFRLPTQTLERPLEATPGRPKQAEQQRVFTESRSATQITGPFADSIYPAAPPSFSERPTEGTTGLSRRITRCLKERTLSTPYHSPMRTRGRLSATLASFFRQQREGRSGTAS